MIVGIDAASTDLSIALVEPDGTLVAEDAWTSQQRQSAELLPRLLELLDGNDRALVDLSALAVGTGPGSFTGLRVAMALAKGLAVGLSRPLFGIGSLASWLEADAGAAAAIARAGAHEGYVLLRDADAPVLADERALRDRLGNERVVAPLDVASAFGLADVASPRAAAAIARGALRRLPAEPGGDDVAAIEPIYLRPPRGVESASHAEVRWL